MSKLSRSVPSRRTERAASRGTRVDNQPTTSNLTPECERRRCESKHFDLWQRRAAPTRNDALLAAASDG